MKWYLNTQFLKIYNLNPAGWGFTVDFAWYPFLIYTALSVGKDGVKFEAGKNTVLRKANRSIADFCDLMHRGVDVWAKDEEGKNLLDLAIEDGNTALAYCLVRFYGFTNVPKGAQDYLLKAQKEAQPYSYERRKIRWVNVSGVFWKILRGGIEGRLLNNFIRFNFWLRGQYNNILRIRFSRNWWLDIHAGFYGKEGWSSFSIYSGLRGQYLQIIKLDFSFFHLDIGLGDKWGNDFWHEKENRWYTDEEEVLALWLKQDIDSLIPHRKEVCREFYISKCLKIYNKDFANFPCGRSFELALPWLHYVKFTFKKLLGGIFPSNDFGLDFEIDLKGKLYLGFTLFGYVFKLTGGKNTIVRKSNFLSKKSIDRFLLLGGKLYKNIKCDTCGRGEFNAIKHFEGLQIAYLLKYAVQKGANLKDYLEDEHSESIFNYGSLKHPVFEYLYDYIVKNNVAIEKLEYLEEETICLPSWAQERLLELKKKRGS